MKFKKVFESDIEKNSGENDLHSAHQVDSNSKEDMDAFDQFGPKTRAVMNDMAVKWSAAQTLKHMKSMGMNPADPSVDHQIAHHLKMSNDSIKRELRANQSMAVESVILEAVKISG